MDVYKLLQDIEKENIKKESNYKYKRGQSVKVTEDKTKLELYFSKLCTSREAKMISNTLAGKVCMIFRVEELTDNDGIKGLYCNLDDDGYLYLLPIDMISEIE